MAKLHHKNLSELRKEYAQGALDPESVSKDPIDQFKEWFQEAFDAELPEPNAMTLSTSDIQGKPSGRIVLLKGVDDKGFVFYTNYQSRKGEDLANNPYASLTFLWLELERQVRVEGAVEKVDGKEADDYFRSRPFGSRISAIVSPQSQPIDSKESLLKEIQKLEATYRDQEVPRPSFWGGYRVKPDMVEFWQGRPNRFHDRIAYYKIEDWEWEIKRLAP